MREYAKHSSPWLQWQFLTRPIDLIVNFQSQIMLTMHWNSTATVNTKYL